MADLIERQQAIEQAITDLERVQSGNPSTDTVANACAWAFRALLPLVTPPAAPVPPAPSEAQQRVDAHDWPEIERAAELLVSDAAIARKLHQPGSQSLLADVGLLIPRLLSVIRNRTTPAVPPAPWTQDGNPTNPDECRKLADILTMPMDEPVTALNWRLANILRHCATLLPAAPGGAEPPKE